MNQFVNVREQRTPSGVELQMRLVACGPEAMYGAAWSMRETTLPPMLPVSAVVSSTEYTKPP